MIRLLISAVLALSLLPFTAQAQTKAPSKDPAVIAALANQKARARQIWLKRGIWGHFRNIDQNNDTSFTYREMDTYFVTMHHAFDVDGNGVVTVQEAPPIMLRYTLSGRPFPRQGLTRSELRTRLQALFKVLDKNNNRKLSLRELM